MDPRLLDVLHDAADQHLVAVADRIDIDLDRIVEEPIEQHRAVVRDLHGIGHVGAQVVLVKDDLHGTTAEHIGRSDHQRETDLAGERERLRLGAGGGVGGLSQSELLHELLEALAVFGDVDGLRRSANDGHPRTLERAAELERRLAAVLHDDALGLLAVQHLEHILEGERFEIKAVGGVVIGRHGLRVAVDHDGLETILAQRHRGMHAAVVELDALADAVRAATQDRDLAARRGRRLALFFVGRVQVGGGGGELGSTGVDALEDRTQPERMTPGAQFVLGHADEPREARIGEAAALQCPHPRKIEGCDALGVGTGLLVDEFGDLRQEPRVDA